MDDKSYWAAETDDRAFAAALNERIANYTDDLQLAGRIGMWRRAIRLYFGYDADGGWSNSSAVTYGGETGETVLLRANQFRAFLRSMLTITTGSRPAFTARPKNADSRSQQEAKLAEAILDFYISDQGLEDTAISTAIFSLLLGEGWYELIWDPQKGQPWQVEERYSADDEEALQSYEQQMGEYEAALAQYDMQEGEGPYRSPGMDGRRPEEPARPDVELMQLIRYTGDIATRALKPEDVVRDPNLERLEDLQWVMVRRLRNRWDLMAQYPEHADEIRNATRNVNRERIRTRIRRIRKNEDDSDLVEVWEFYHKACESLPQGRYALLIDETVLLDTAMPYDEIPVYPMVPSMEIDEPYGYGESWDLMALQQCYDACLATMVSNQTAFGLANVWTTPGSNLTVKDLGGGLKHIESTVKPEPLNLLPPNSITIDLNNQILQAMQAISGINDVARGEAQASQSGSALAMMASMAVQFNSSLQRAYGRMWEQVGTGLVKTFQRWATIPRTIEVAGRLLTPQIREVQGDDIANVNSIAVEMGNPIMRTSAGKMEIADKLLAAGAIQSPEQYMEVQATGRLEPLYSRPRAQRLLINSENEALMTGKPTKALISDDHKNHIAEHASLLDEPSIRWDDALVQAIHYHIQEHTALWAQASPLILAATDQQPAPMMGGAPLGPPPPGGPGGGPPSPGPKGNGAGGGANMPDASRPGGMPEQPQMPKNPLSGVRVSGPSGP